ncbi:molybdopterin biosynthesis protein [Halobacteriales archaeon QH_2_65_14]|nr:MAG: molybdopterin biosynthesis protein [Halobacteriales archaeon QH_2_65_14]
MRKEFRDLADPEKAQSLVRGLHLGGGTETVALTGARGRVLAERVDAGIDVPGFDRATVDGYALRAADTFGAGEAEPARLEVAGTVHAGEKPGVSVEAGTAVEVSTGAVLPPDANAVVKVERTASDEGAVLVRTAVAPGDGIMVAGADVSAGERALGPGTHITPREVALLSALGVEEVPVRQAPRVGIVSTGDELVRPGGSLDSETGQIYDVNSYAIATSVEEAGGEPVVYPHVGDDFDELERELKEASQECDLVLSSGSTSAGAVDVIYRIIEKQGELLCHGVAVKPGKPMLIGELGGAAYVGLPGYPVSALTIFQSTTIRPSSIRVRRSGCPAALRMTGATTSLVDADGIVEMSPDTEQLDAGEPVDVTLFSPDIRPPSVLGMGEDDPLFSRLLDRLDRPRYLPLGSREGLRRLREGVPDVAVTAGPTRRAVESVDLGGWTREWGVVVPAGNPGDVSGVASLVDRDVQFVNHDRQSGLRGSFEAELESLAENRGVTRDELVDAIDGFGLAARGRESPARRVLTGKADVAIGLRATAAKLGLDFVPVGTQQVHIRAPPDRTEKAGLGKLKAMLPPEDMLDDMEGFERLPDSAGE